MNIKQLLMGSLALAAIGGASSVGLYYQSLTMERKENKRKADEYYTEALYDSLYIYGKSTLNLDEELKKLVEEQSGSKYGDGTLKEVQNTKKQMIADGYSYAEIGIIDAKAWKKVIEDLDKEITKGHQ